MIDLAGLIWENWGLTLVIVIFVHVFKVVRKLVVVSMAISSASSPSPRSSSSHPSITWKRLSETTAAHGKRLKESSRRECGAERDNGSVVLEPCVDSTIREEKTKVANSMTRRRPARIVIPQLSMSATFDEVENCDSLKDFAVEGDGYCVASKRGNKKVMEDGYGVITSINGDSKQAYFGVFDGHGGSAAVDFVSEKLGQNIITALNEMDKKGCPPEMAIRSGYLITDKDFLMKNLGSGACAATVLLKDGEVHAAHVGDCKIVMSRKGVAYALTIDHRAERQDERNRIESSGGFVNCHNGVWRVQDSLSISRAIGDLHMKDLIISEPETNSFHLSSDSDFLIIASDGLWDKVGDQEAVDVVLRHKNSIQSCKKLVGISSSRGCRDDITVMVVDLKRYADDREECRNRRNNRGRKDLVNIREGQSCGRGENTVRIS